MLTQAILIGLIAAFGKFDCQLGTLYAFRPIVLCPLVGLVLGDLQSGLAIGASLELLFMGSISIGAYVPPDETIGGVLACAFAIQLGQSTEAAIALAMPIATLCLAIKNILNAALPILVDRADAFSGQGNLKGVYAMHFLIGSTGIIMAFLLCSLSFYLGADAIQGLLDFIPPFVLAGFGVAANILPAMGFAMLGRLVLTKQLVPFYFLGFLLCSYANVPVLGVALIAIIIGIDKFDLLGLGGAQPSSPRKGMRTMTSSPENKITRSDLVKSAVNVGALGMEFSWTYYKQMNIAFCLMVANMLKKIYAGRPDDYAEALHRHCAFFNITVQFAPFVGGIAMAMEEKVARGQIEPESVNDVKAALMGPLSGIGDSIFLSTLRVVAAAVGISLCQAGNPFGPIAFLLIYNVPGFALRVWGAVKGYELGVGFLDEAQRTGLMQKIMTCVGIVGVMVVGAMCKDMFWASIPVALGSGDDAQTLQDILDGIMPGMLGMIAFWLYYWLLSKKINPMVLIVATMVVGIVGAFFGVLA